MFENQGSQINPLTSFTRYRSEALLPVDDDSASPISAKTQTKSRFRSQSDGQLHLRSAASLSEVAAQVGGSESASYGPAYENYFVGDDSELYKLAHQCQAFSIIQKPDDLQQDNLAKDVVIAADGSFKVRDGLLFGKEPVSLLIDLRRFAPELLPELNELFEKPARFQGRVLGNNVRIVSVLSQHMLPDGRNQDSVPGPDFWWRINSTCPPVEAREHIKQQLSPQEWVTKTIASFENESEGDELTQVIDFTGKDWRSLLLGTPEIDGNGRLIYHPGALQALKSGQHVVLKNAPWSDMTFVLRMFDIFHKEQFYCNGEWIPLPESLKLSRQPLSQGEVQTMAGKLHWLQSEACVEKPQRVACINKETFAQLMQETVLTEEGVIRRSDSLENWLSKADCIRITSPLVASQWLQLIKRLQAVNRLNLPIIVDALEKQPPFIRSVSPELDNHEPLQDFSGCKVQIALRDTRSSQLPLTPPEGEEPVEEFVILPEQSLIKVSRHTRIQSLKERHFDCQVTRLIRLLREGKPVCLTGLQSNPVLLQQLESLLCNPPHLIVFGKCEEFPRMALTVTWPKGMPMPSSVWHSYLESMPDQVGQVDDRDDFSKHSLQALSFCKLKRLYGEMGNLQAATYCPAFPPADIHKVFAKVLDQAECEREFDGGKELQSYHIYKAISSIVLKEYRGNTEVYCYLKNLCFRMFQPESLGELWMDREYLLGWLSRHPVIDQGVVKKHFWCLAKAFPANTFQSRQIPEKEDIVTMTAHLIALACNGEEDDSETLQLHQELAKIEPLSVSRARHWQEECINRSLRREKQFYHMLATLEDGMRQPGLVHQQAQQLAKAAAKDDAELELAISNVLTPAIQGNAELRAKFLNASPDWRSWEACRIQRLAAKVRKHPVVFIKGETGAGKSYIAEAVARQLNPDSDPIVITVGPEIEVSDLLGRMSLNETGDTQTQSTHAPLREWVERRSDKEIVIIIDEANLANPELWNCLKGLYDDPSCLYCHGEKVFLTPQHRIIMTGNPDHFGGRRMNELLRIHAPQLYYPLLKPAFIQEKILRSGLTEMLSAIPHLAEDNKVKAQDHLMQSITQLYEVYPSLLPGRVFTPRDLTDIISRIHMYLSAHSEQVTLTEAGVNGLVWQVMDDSLGGEVTEERQANKAAMKHWYQGRRQVDNSLTLPHQAAFDCFYQHWLVEQGGYEKTAVQLDCSNDSVHALMRRIWQEQRRSQQECAAKAPHRGRHATIIVGPAGRGKSALLGQQLCFMCRQEGLPAPRQINAGKHSWELLRQAVIEAKRAGRILIISEPNLLKSEELEGLMNNITTGEAEPGFHVYATANDSGFVGRHRFSPALKNRFTCISITDYTTDDIRKIAQSVFAGQLSDQQTRQIVQWYLQLLQHLRQKRIPLRPLVGDLQKLADTLKRQGFSSSSPVEPLKHAFKKQYGIYLTVGKCSLESLSPLQDETSEVVDKCLTDLSQMLNSAPTQTAPVVLEASRQTDTIHASSSSSVAMPNALLTSDKAQEIEEVRAKTTLALALAKWKEKAGTVVCPYEYDTLYSACYCLWQRNFFKNTLSLSPDILQFSQEQRETLALPENKALCAQIEELIEQEPSPEGLELLWEKLSPLAQQPSAYLEKVAQFDGKTAYRQQTYLLECTFDSVHPNYQRIDVSELLVDGNNLIIASIAPGQAGFDVICPQLLKGPVHMMGSEHYGTCVRKLETEVYIPLTGVYPHQTISQFCTEPHIPMDAFDIMRDRKTGQMVIRVNQIPLGCKPPMEITLHYVLKKVVVPCTSRDTDTLPDQSSPFLPVVGHVLKETDFMQRDTLDFIGALTGWGEKFESGSDITGSNDIEILKGLVNQRCGSCRHRCWAAYAVAEAKSIPVRQIFSGSHTWLEMSPDNGRSWLWRDLGGSSGHKSTFYGYPKKPSVRGLIVSEEEREKLLAEAVQNPAAFASRMKMTQEEVEAWIASDGFDPLPTKDSHRVHWDMLSSGELHKFKIALTMLKSGAFRLQHNNENQESYLYDLGDAFSEVFVQCKTPQEREAACELLYSVKHLFPSTDEKSQEEYWYLLVRTIYTCLGNLHFKHADQISETSLFMPFVFEFFASCILKEDLLDQLTEQQCKWVYGRLWLHSEDIVPEQYRKTLQQINDKFNKHYGHYLPSIEARTVLALPVKSTQRPQGRRPQVSCSPTLESKVRTTEIGTGFTWQPEGELVVSRLLQQQAPFREQKAVAATKPVKLIQSYAPVLRINSGWFNWIYAGYFSQSSYAKDLIPDEIWDKVGVDSSPTLSIYLSQFCYDPTQECADSIFKILERKGISVPDAVRRAIQARIDNRKIVDDMLASLPQSFAHYVTKLTRASSGNLWFYHLLQSEKYRGYSKPVSAEALLEADSVSEEFLQVPPQIVREHMQKDDKNSLMVTSGELANYMDEFATQLQFSEV